MQQTILLLLFAHWVGDFLLQSRWMGTHKSKRWDVLLLHVTTYSATLFVAAWAMTGALPWAFIAVNFGAHFVTDAITSRITSRLYVLEEYYWFFAVIDFDQFIHAASLILTIGLLVQF